MKTISVLLALTALLFTDLALAAGAQVTSLTGTVQVQTGAAAPRTLRQGDQVAQGDTVSTGPGSSVVLRFDDGQVAALTAQLAHADHRVRVQRAGAHAATCCSRWWSAACARSRASSAITIRRT